MRADGEVDKEQFQSLKSEIDMKIHTLKEQIAAFMPEEDESEDMEEDTSEVSEETVSDENEAIENETEPEEV